MDQGPVHGNSFPLPHFESMWIKPWKGSIWPYICRLADSVNINSQHWWL